jgi:hypothetical protein
MPWEVRRAGAKYQVVKKGGGGVVGTHATAELARRQLQALYANEPGGKTSSRQAAAKRAGKRKTTHGSTVSAVAKTGAGGKAVSAVAKTNRKAAVRKMTAQARPFARQYMKNKRGS